PADGVVDVAGLLSGYLREARSKGATILFGEEVVRIERPVEGGEINRVVTSTGRTFEPEVLVCTGGAWAASLARLAGAAPPPMRPLLRHLFHTEPGGEVDPMAPWVWDEGHGWYARPETGGFLLCACDEVPSEPCLPITDPAAEEHLAAVLTEHAPSLTGLPLARRWAGLRTFAPDRSFVIGWDADVPGLFWLSGLGGHGVTTSAAVGALAARLLQEGPGAEHPAFSPARSA
ncbi:MAG: NAD(P)/FAD-dependent oxidoreductase, partial [Planctomycetota bacterium]